MSLIRNKYSIVVNNTFWAISFCVIFRLCDSCYILIEYELYFYRHINMVNINHILLSGRWKLHPTNNISYNTISIGIAWDWSFSFNSHVLQLYNTVQSSRRSRLTHEPAITDVLGVEDACLYLSRSIKSPLFPSRSSAWWYWALRKQDSVHGKTELQFWSPFVKRTSEIFQPSAAESQSSGTWQHD